MSDNNIKSTKKKNILDTICDQRRVDVQIAKQLKSAQDLRDAISNRKDDNVVNLFSRIKDGLHVAAEFKRASPSKGDIATHLSAAEQTLKYAKAGASVISVLTEPKWFKGSLKDMEDVARAMRENFVGKNRPAVLRKDFILDKYQILEARAYGADTVLIIVAAIEDESELKDLIEFSRSLSMEPLVEVNSESELDIALRAGAKVIGVNNRNLKTFQVDLQTTDRCAIHLQKRLKVEGRTGSVVLMALSGVSCREHVEHYESVGGVSGVLVGEAMMRAKDPGQLVASLLGREILEVRNNESLRRRRTCVKICGIQNVEDALAAARAGADLIGLIFVKTSKRSVSLGNAEKIVSAIRRFRESDRVILKRRRDSSKNVQDDWYISRQREIESICSKHRPLVVGVFQNHDFDDLCDVVRRVRLDAVQLHGDETSDYTSKCPVPTISVLHVDIRSNSLDTLVQKAQDLRGKTDAILLDSRVSGQAGGTGKVFDWQMARRLPKTISVILAGGLKPSNVSDAIIQARPWCVDVAGGVAKEDGVTKDHDRIVSFLSNAKSVMIVGEEEDTTVNSVRAVITTLVLGFSIALMMMKRR